MRQIIPLNDEEKQTYEWQMWVPDVGEEGQEKLKASTVLISRCGGLGGVVAYELAAAGVGKLIIAHGGNVKHSDLNRQLLMTHDWLGKPRVESAKRRLNELNPHIEIETIPENINESNAEELVSKVDIVADCAPLFEERFLMNQESVKQNKPMVESAMYELEAHITTVIPGSSPCLACVYPEKPPYWKRQFPVFGAVSGTVGCMAAMEVIKLITGIGSTLSGKLFTFNLRDMSFKTLNIRRNPQCNICSG